MIYFVMVLSAASVSLLVLAVANFAPSRPAAVDRRIASIQAGGRQRNMADRRRRQVKRERLAALVEAMGKRMGQIKNERDMRARLVHAGYRQPSALYIYLGARVLLAAGLFVFVLISWPLAGVAGGRVVLGPAMAAAAGWLLPRIVLSRRIKKRQKELQKALPDTLDLMVICVEAGLGLNQALTRVSEEMESLSGPMSEELHIVNLEIRAGTPREEALRNMGDRTNVTDLRQLVAMLIQTDRFGTSIAQALRVQADNLRTARRQRAEEAAAKTTIKMLFPLVLFIFPAMFVVILGPAVFHLIELFTKAR
ncbi:MAG: type II secretion system F family protein [Gemmatimonadota bacterium]|jgi:tight adherence protein C|nr:MAG: type II secretion system F family protein [Gemmatimonadota bacterium]